MTIFLDSCWESGGRQCIIPLSAVLLPRDSRQSWVQCLHLFPLCETLPILVNSLLFSSFPHMCQFLGKVFADSLPSPLPPPKRRVRTSSRSLPRVLIRARTHSLSCPLPYLPAGLDLSPSKSRSRDTPLTLPILSRNIVQPLMFNKNLLNLY